MATKKLKKLTIDRKVWLRGEGEGELLRASDGKMCCLGIYLKACGKAPRTLLGKAMPSELSKRVLPEEALWLVKPRQPEEDSVGGDDFTNSSVAGQLMGINDDKAYLKDKETGEYVLDEDWRPVIDPKGESVRERKIKAAFKKQGIEVEFVG